MRRAAEKSDDLLFMRLDHQFNTLISAASRNEFASRAMGLMHGLSRRFWYQHYKEAADLPLAARLHADVAEAIAERRVDAGRPLTCAATNPGWMREFDLLALRS